MASNPNHHDEPIPAAILAESQAARARIRARIEAVAARIEAWPTSRRAATVEGSPGEPDEVAAPAGIRLAGRARDVE